MTDYLAQANVLKAMAHPMRLQMLDLLRGGETCVCHVERALNRRQAYVSQQFMVLRDAGLVEARKDGLQVYYRLADDALEDLLEQLCGPIKAAEFRALDDCHCPSCTTVHKQASGVSE